MEKEEISKQLRGVHDAIMSCHATVVEIGLTIQAAQDPEGALKKVRDGAAKWQQMCFDKCKITRAERGRTGRERGGLIKPKGVRRGILVFPRRVSAIFFSPFSKTIQRSL